MVGLEDFKEIPGFDSSNSDIIERPKMGSILEAGRMAPSPGNVHTVEFVVVEDDEKKHHLGEILGDDRIEDAPASIVVLCDPDRMSRRVENGVEACFAEVSAAVQNMRLMAATQGICSNLAMSFDSDSVIELVKAPRDKMALAVLSLAYTERPVRSSERFGMNEICFYNEYENQITSAFDSWEWEGVKEESSVYMKKMKAFRQRLRDLWKRV